MKNSPATVVQSAQQERGVIPLKFRNQKPSPLELYGAMVLSSDFSSIHRTMIQERWVKNEKRAKECVYAFLQWLAVGALLTHRKYLMFHGPVDKAFHAAILNTKWYHNFCLEHIGCYVHHDPLDKNEASNAINNGGIKYTIENLCSAFGEKLHPELKKWVRLSQKENLTASNVSCVCNGYDD